MHSHRNARAQMALILIAVVTLIAGHATGARCEVADEAAPWSGSPRMDMDTEASGPSVGLVVRISWLPPRTDPPPVTYDVQVLPVYRTAELDTLRFSGLAPGEDLEVDDMGELTMILAGRLQYMEPVMARVRATDAEGGLIPWSPWSPVHVFEIGPPEP